jgi:hypothetical protein
VVSYREKPNEADFREDIDSYEPDTANPDMLAGDDQRG